MPFEEYEDYAENLKRIKNIDKERKELEEKKKEVQKLEDEYMRNFGWDYRERTKQLVIAISIAAVIIVAVLFAFSLVSYKKERLAYFEISRKSSIQDTRECLKHIDIEDDIPLVACVEAFHQTMEERRCAKRKDTRW